MPSQRTQPTPTARTLTRVARRYRTCAEALAAAQAMEALAEDEVSELRQQGRDAEADRRADAWAAEIARAHGEAAGLSHAASNETRPKLQPKLSSHTSRAPSRRRANGPAYELRLLLAAGRAFARLWRRSPLAATIVAVFAGYLTDSAIRALAPYATAIAVVSSALILTAVAAEVIDRRNTGGSHDR